MDAVDCIQNRMSIRAFKKEPVPKELLTEILDIARWSPSYKNSQPWEIIVVSGAKKEGLSQVLVDLQESGAPSCPDIAAPESWPEAEQARITSLFARRKELTGIDLAAPEMIVKAKKVNFRFYGAPHAVFLFQESSLSLWSLFDLGLFAQSLMLAAHARGLGMVPQAFTTDYAQDVKKYLDIPASKRLVLGLSLGYPDMDSPANSFRTERSPVAEIATFME